MDMEMNRPGRPLGLTLAILLSAFLYGIIPLAILGMQTYIQNRVNSSVTGPFEYEGESFEIISSGGSSPIISLEQILIDGGGAVLFLLICVVVWRGGKWWMRGLLSGAVVIYSVITLAASLRVLLAPASLENGISSADSVLNALCSGGLIVSILVPLYVLWYVNRAPARAFFRGYYIDEHNSASPAEA